MFARCLPLALGLLCLAGCVVEVHSGPTRHEFREFERQGSERLHLDLHMGAGELKVRGGATKLARADFAYNVDQWKPEVTYRTLGGACDLTIEQPGNNHTHIGDTTYTWDVQLADDVPTELTAHLGAGEARLNLGSLSLRRVDVEMGVGEVRMDLRGTPKHDYDVRINGGVGKLPCTCQGRRSLCVGERRHRRHPHRRAAPPGRPLGKRRLQRSASTWTCTAASARST